MDNNDSIFYAIKQNTSTANNFYAALGQPKDKSGKIISELEFTQNFPILFMKNKREIRKSILVAMHFQKSLRQIAQDEQLIHQIFLSNFLKNKTSE